ncbi:hypothetical protein [Blastococcus mobilis]|uniref:Uncharacterized protein n=1 Tax=Blastococcus mobilis TaxID=1938746 RepID=A0A238ZRT9_9ACTN|nr:hypothetical protein [Blastococcus mobilis]SNR85909.1 hypothetical protein SAMN06272737_13215 [Blastococcus mobilis]
MTVAIPAQRGSNEPVTVLDDQLVIRHLRLDHPETVALAARELAEHGPEALTDTVSAALVVGMVAAGLQRSGGNHAAVMQRALAGFDRALEQRATDTLTQLDGLLNQVTASEQATRQAAEAALADLPRRIEQGLAAALTGGAGDVREAVRQAAVTAQREALGQLESVVRTHSDSVRSVVSTENPASPLSALRRDLTAAVDGARRELGEGLAALQALVQAQQAGQAAARKNSAAVGKDWEDRVAVGVASWAQATGDLIEHVGSQPAPGTTRRVGDVLVRIITSTSTRPVLIVEAKRRQRRPSMRAFRDELNDALRVRGAHSALAVVETADDVPGPGSWARVDRTCWVVAADRPELLTLVLGIVRELTILAAAQTGADSSVDIGRARTAVDHLLDLLSRFDDVSKHVSTAEKTLTNIRATADGLRQALTVQIQDAHHALRAGTQGG